MLFRQLFDAESYTYTYILADKRGGEAIIIDPVKPKYKDYIKIFSELDISLANLAEEIVLPCYNILFHPSSISVFSVVANDSK